tara:strand:+ start:221 stop:928 length:708 start_codon:yes stop_codon:yes gene_type:complete
VSILGALGLAAPLIASGGTTRALSRTRPLLRNSKRANSRLDSALDKHIDDIKPGATLNYGITFNEPTKQGFGAFNEVRNDQVKYGGSTPPSASPHIAINPNSDRAYLAHEMGHLASQQTDVGHFVATLRENPKLKTALLGALVTVPGIAAALEAGDDDMDSSIALAALATAPALADEALATRHGLAIMNKADLRASLGQRGKLAGGLLSYLAAPIIAGASGNAIGNLFDKDTIAP